MVHRAFALDAGREPTEEFRVERVGTLLDRLEGNDVLRLRIAEARALESWPEIVGAPLAQRTRPLRLAGRRLFVLCHGAPLRQELTYHKREILRKFNEAAGMKGAARQLVFLESDANLSSLVKEAELEDHRRQVSESAARRAALPARSLVSSEGEQETESADARIAAAYPTFRGDDYRRQMEDIAAERGQKKT